MAARILDVALIAYLVAMTASAAGDWATASPFGRVDLVLYGLVTTGLVALVVLRPAPRVADHRPSVLALCAFSATYPLLYRPGWTTDAVIVLHLLGDAALLSLGRAFALLPALRGLQTRGLYAVVRHPAYATYLATDAIFVASTPDPWNFVVALLGAASLVSRAHLEERVLDHDPAYAAYRTRVRWRLFPFVY